MARLSLAVTVAVLLFASSVSAGVDLPGNLKMHMFVECKDAGWSTHPTDAPISAACKGLDEYKCRANTACEPFSIYDMPAPVAVDNYEMHVFVKCNDKDWQSRPTEPTSAACAGLDEFKCRANAACEPFSIYDAPAPTTAADPVPQVPEYVCSKLGYGTFCFMWMPNPEDPSETAEFPEGGLSADQIAQIKSCDRPPKEGTREAFGQHSIEFQNQHCRALFSTAADYDKACVDECLKAHCPDCDDGHTAYTMFAARLCMKAKGGEGCKGVTVNPTYRAVPDEDHCAMKLLDDQDEKGPCVPWKTECAIRWFSCVLETGAEKVARMFRGL